MGLDTAPPVRPSRQVPLLACPAVAPGDDTSRAVGIGDPTDVVRR
jgi:hypothetical protein